MNVIIWIVMGGMLGWLTSVVRHTESQQETLLNVLLGVAGALLGGWLLAPLFCNDAVDPTPFSIPSLLVSVLGAAVLLAIVNILRRDKVR